MHTVCPRPEFKLLRPGAIFILFRILSAYVMQAAVLREEQELTV